MDEQWGFVAERLECGLHASSGHSAVGEKPGPENGVNRRTETWRVSPGTQRMPRISHGYHPSALRCPRCHESTGVLVCGWAVFHFEHELQLNICGFEFEVSPHHRILRPLFVHRNMGTSSMVGNQVSNLLREIKYRTHETTHFEPQHIQYLPVRSKLVEIVETQVTETNGDLLAFGKGQTLLTLHFKKG